MIVTGQEYTPFLVPRLADFDELSRVVASKGYPGAKDPPIPDSLLGAGA